MKKQYHLDLSHDLLKHKLIVNGEQNYYPSAKRTIKQTSNPYSYNQSFTFNPNPQQSQRKTTQPTDQYIQNPQKIKSSSLYEKSKGTNKLDYISFAQRQFKEQKKIQGQKQKEIDIKQLAELKWKMQNYFIDLKKKDEIIIKNEKQIHSKDRKIQQANERIKLMQNDYIHCQNELNQLLQKFKINHQYYSALAENHNSLSQKCAQLEQILQHKDAFIQKIIHSKDQEYHSAIKCKNNEIQVLQQRLNILETENSALVNKISQLQTQQQLYEGKMQANSSINDLSALGQQFQSRINYYVDENNRLKNMVSHYEGQVQHLMTQKDSLENTLKAYQQRDKAQKSSVLQEQLIFLRNALQNEKEQKDKAISRYQLQILKLQNRVNAKWLQTHTNLINMFDEQRLHQSLYLALQQIERLKTRLSFKQKAK